MSETFVLELSLWSQLVQNVHNFRNSYAFFIIFTVYGCSQKILNYRLTRIQCVRQNHSTYIKSQCAPKWTRCLMPWALQQEKLSLCGLFRGTNKVKEHISVCACVCVWHAAKGGGARDDGVSLCMMSGLVWIISTPPDWYIPSIYRDSTSASPAQRPL